jgi:formylglycine-generating enzyme required for sulfatase activity
VAEWTASKWKPADKNDSQVVARGGSWQDIPYRARPGSRAPYRPEMKVVDVGFRVIATALSADIETARTP